MIMIGLSVYYSHKKDTIKSLYFIVLALMSQVAILIKSVNLFMESNLDIVELISELIR